jgi:hypothetical protein
MANGSWTAYRSFPSTAKLPLYHHSIKFAIRTEQCRLPWRPYVDVPLCYVADNSKTAEFEALIEFLRLSSLKHQETCPRHRHRDALGWVRTSSVDPLDPEESKWELKLEIAGYRYCSGNLRESLPLGQLRCRPSARVVTLIGAKAKGS